MHGTDPKLLYRYDEATKVLGVGRSTLFALIAEGRLEAVNVGRRKLIRRSELERFAASLGSGT